MNNPIIFPRAYKQFVGLKYLNTLIRIRDPGWKKFGSGMEKFGSGIKHPGSATLLATTTTHSCTYM
jgi:hypothetical protein